MLTAQTFDALVANNMGVVNKAAHFISAQDVCNSRICFLFFLPRKQSCCCRRRLLHKFFFWLHEAWTTWWLRHHWLKGGGMSKITAGRKNDTPTCLESHGVERVGE